MNGRYLSHAQRACSSQYEDDDDAINQRHWPSRRDGDGQRGRYSGPAVADVPSYGDDGQQPKVSRRLGWIFDGAKGVGRV